MQYECLICLGKYKDPLEAQKCYKNCMKILKLTREIMNRKSWTYLKYKRLQKLIFRISSFPKENPTGKDFILLGRLLEEYTKICKTCYLYDCNKHRGKNAQL